jgi:hypothetical protein
MTSQIELNFGGNESLNEFCGSPSSQSSNEFETVYSYSRAQAIEDGVLVSGMDGDFLEVSQQHFKYPVAMTSAVFEIIKKAVDHPAWANDYKGVWHDILWMSRAHARQVNDSTRIFQVIIKGAGRKSLFTFKIVCGPGDNAEPVLTVMLPNED